LGIDANYFVRLMSSGSGLPAEIADFRHFLHLARRMQSSLHPGGLAAGRSGRNTMTFNLTSLQQIALSVVGALFAASLSISAAVGPVAHII
jgi:hypothetical protein